MKTRHHTTRSAAAPPNCRRGFSVLVVLLLLAVTLGLSYASIRSQSVHARIQRNATFRTSARSAALSGLSIALKVMHTDAWKGVDTTLTGRLNAHENFEVRFSTGDPALTSADADYDRYPLRVTLDAVGYAADPLNPATIATHRARAVVELIPRALSEPPAGFDDLLAHTLSQWDSGDCSLCVPFRAEGPVRFRSRLYLSSQLEWTTDPWWWYHLGLNQMRAAGQPDWRPLTGPVRFSFTQQASSVRSLLPFALQVSTIDASSSRVLSGPDTDAMTSYRLYPGGKAYPVAEVGANLENVHLQPDPESNPAGLFARSGVVQLHNRVTLRGSLFTRGGSSSDIEIYGDQVRMEAVDLWPLDGTDEPIQLPVLVSADDLRFHSGSVSQLTGVVLAQDDFDVRAAHQDRITLRIEGHASGRDLYIRPREPWDRDKDWWSDMWLDFWAQRSSGIPWFPEWLRKNVALAIEPRIVFAPNSRAIRYHCYNPAHTIYAPHSDDEGLRWNVVRWMMNP